MSSTQPKWLGKEPEYIPEQCDEIIETDVIVGRTVTVDSLLGEVRSL